MKYIDSGAYISTCKKYRYSLRRVWDPSKGTAMFVLLNPSTADWDTDDNTIKRCVGFAADLGYGGICVCNLFGYRTKSPKILKKASEPVGKFNDRILLKSAFNADIVICGWGTDGKLNGRHDEVLKLLRSLDIKLYALRITKNGYPSHPLYLPKSCRPIPL